MAGAGTEEKKKKRSALTEGVIVSNPFSYRGIF